MIARILNVLIFRLLGKTKGMSCEVLKHWLEKPLHVAFNLIGRPAILFFFSERLRFE